MYMQARVDVGWPTVCELVLFDTVAGTHAFRVNLFRPKKRLLLCLAIMCLFYAKTSNSQCQP